MEVHGLRRVDDGEVRRHGGEAGRVPGWLLSKDSQAAMPGGGRSFRRRTAEFWEVWPMPVPDGELHRVLYVDGIWVARDLVVLICCSGCVSSRGFEQKEHRKLSSLSIGSAHAF